MKMKAVTDAVIPAAPGYQIWTPVYDHDDGIVAEFLPNDIIAWHVEVVRYENDKLFRWVTPLTINADQDAPGDCKFVISTPHGQWVVPDVTEYNNADEAFAEVRKSIKRDCDWRQKQRANKAA